MIERNAMRMRPYAPVAHVEQLMVEHHHRVERRHGHLWRQRRNARLRQLHAVAGAQHESARRRPVAANGPNAVSARIVQLEPAPTTDLMP